MVSTVSSRRTTTKAGSRAWVASQDAQRALGTHTRTQRSPVRNERVYPDQNVIDAEHAGQTGRGTSSSRPAARY